MSTDPCQNHFNSFCFVEQVAKNVYFSLKNQWHSLKQQKQLQQSVSAREIVKTLKLLMFVVSEMRNQYSQQEVCSTSERPDLWANGTKCNLRTLNSFKQKHQQPVFSVLTLQSNGTKESFMKVLREQPAFLNISIPISNSPHMLMDCSKFKVGEVDFKA